MAKDNDKPVEEKVFAIGDVVSLKSGGVPMTVNGVKGNEIDCVWFGDDHLVKQRVFQAHVLVEVKR